MSGDGRRSVYDKKRQRYTEDNKQYLNVRSSKSKAEVTEKHELEVLTDTKHRAVSLRQQSYLFHIPPAVQPDYQYLVNSPEITYKTGQMSVRGSELSVGSFSVTRPMQPNPSTE